MANISLGTLRDYWKAVYDWVTGAVVYHARVLLHGSDDGGTTKRVVKTKSTGEIFTAAADGDIAGLGALAAAAVTDPAASASVIAALKGLLTLAGALNAPAVADPAASASLNALIKGVLTDLGQTGDALVAAGAAGSVSAKLRRLTNDLAAILAKIAPDAENAAITANPLAIGGRYDSADRTLHSGDVGAVAVDPAGRLRVSPYDAAAISGAPAGGSKTVTTVAAELYAGASRLANRYMMTVLNVSPIPVYLGPSGVTTANAPWIIQPNEMMVFAFRPNVATAIYAVAAGNAEVRVGELV